VFSFVAMATRQPGVIKNFLQAFSISISAAREWSVCAGSGLGIWFLRRLPLTGSRVDPWPPPHQIEPLFRLFPACATPRRRLEPPVNPFYCPAQQSPLPNRRIFATSSINWRLCIVVPFICILLCQSVVSNVTSSIDCLYLHWENKHLATKCVSCKNIWPNVLLEATGMQIAHSKQELNYFWLILKIEVTLVYYWFVSYYNNIFHIFICVYINMGLSHSFNFKSYWKREKYLKLESHSRHLIEQPQRRTSQKISGAVNWVRGSSVVTVPHIYVLPDAQIPLEKGWQPGEGVLTGEARQILH